MKRFSVLLSIFIVITLSASCDDDKKTANDLGVGAQCELSTDCDEETQECLLDFKGGYCGVKDCTGDVECPEGSRCVAHDDGTNYCFLICTDKVQCNVNRDVENEANCSSSVTFVEEPQDVKACIPPSN